MQNLPQVSTSAVTEKALRAVPYRSRDDALRDAKRVTEALQEGMSQTKVASMARGPLAYGVGMMIHKMVEKRILTDAAAAYGALNAQFAQVRDHTGKPEVMTRRTVIAHLRKTLIIDPTLSVRALKPSGSTPNINQIIRVTERTTKITAEEILSRNRSRPIVNARFCAMWALRNVSGTSFSVIGEHFGGKDHTTVINAVNQVDIKRLSDNAFRQSTDQLIDSADLIGIMSNMELLTRTAALRAI